MRHPFDLELTELETIENRSVKQLTDEESATITGGNSLATMPSGQGGAGQLTTQALGEEGGSIEYPPIEIPGYGTVQIPPVKVPYPYNTSDLKVEAG
jgi:hypothetical protein